MPTATNILPRTRRCCRDALAAAVVLLAASMAGPVGAVSPLAGATSSVAAAAPPDLHCAWSVAPGARAGGPVRLQFSLSNPGPRAVRVLAWGTPFEGWLSPYIVLDRDGAAVPYVGASVKRGDPGRDEYLRIAAGGRRQVAIDLAQAFDLSRPGRYELQARIVLHDVHAGTAATRPRSQHLPQPLDCPALGFTLAG